MLLSPSENQRGCVLSGRKQLTLEQELLCELSPLMKQTRQILLGRDPQDWSQGPAEQSSWLLLWDLAKCPLAMPTGDRLSGQEVTGSQRPKAGGGGAGTGS